MRGTVRKRIAQDGSVRYDAMFRVGTRQVSKTFPNKKAADGFLSNRVSEVAAGTYRPIVPKRMAGVFADWLKALETEQQLGNLKRSTYRSFHSVVTQHLAPAFGEHRSDDLSVETIATWRGTQAAKVAAGTMAAKTHNNIVGVLKLCLDWAVEKKAFGVSPMPKRMRAAVKTNARLIVQGAEIARLWNATAGQDRLIVALALFGGLRRGELFGLQWGAVTWPKGRQRALLHVAQAFVQRQLVTPKTIAGDRRVNLPSRLVELLRGQERERPPMPLEDGSAFLIRQDDGQPIDPDNWARRVWPTIRSTAKLPEAVTLHGLRHTFGSLLLADGVPVKHVSEQMGHASPTITMQVYQHVLKVTSATATRQLDKHIPGGVKPTRKPLRLVKAGAA